MNIEISFNKELYKNLENIHLDLEGYKKNNNVLIDFEFVTKIHSLKHQLAYLHYTNYAKVILELEKFIIRVIRNNLLISNTQISLMMDIIEYITMHLFCDKEDFDENILDDYLLKLREINKINDLATIKNDNAIINPLFNHTLKRDTLVDISVTLDTLNNFLTSIETLQNFVYFNDKINNEQLKYYLTDMVNNYRKIRNVKLKSLTTKINYIVNAIASDCGKVVKCSIEAKDCYVDQVLIELLIDPITQIIKNNIIHGIESIEERKSKNKTAYGNLYFNFYAVDDLFHIEIINDGRPIDFCEIRKKVSNDKIYNDDEVANFIFSPFVTTKDKTEIDGGSGVGLTGVKLRIEQLGGRISVVSNEKMTQFKIVVPRNFIYTSYYIFKSHSIYYAIPSYFAKDVVDNNSIFGMNIFDVRFNKNNCCNIHNQCFILNIEEEDVFIITDGVLKHFLLTNGKKTLKNEVINGVSSINSNDLVIILNEKMLTKQSKGFWDHLNECKIVFLCCNGKLKKIPINQIKKVKMINETSNYFHEKKGYGNIKVSYINNGKSDSSSFLEIVDIEL